MKKIKFRNYTKDDFKFLHELLSDDETRKFFPFMYTTCKEQTELRLKTRLMDQEWGNTNRVVIVDFKTKKPIGEISGRKATDNQNIMELAIIIHPAYRGQGYAKISTIEFMKKMLKENNNINKFRLEIAERNKSSQMVAAKLEFELNGDRPGRTQYWEKEADEIETQF